MSEECICTPKRGCCCISFCLGDPCHCECEAKNAALTAKLAQMREVVEAAKEWAHGCEGGMCVECDNLRDALSRLTEAPKGKLILEHDCSNDMYCDCCPPAPEKKPCVCYESRGKISIKSDCPSCCPPSPGKEVK